MVRDFTYVSFDADDFISVRKRLLSGSMNTIKILKKYKEFKELRLEEFKLKKELRVELKACQAGLGDFIESIPKVKEELDQLKKARIGVSTKTMMAMPSPEIREVQRPKVKRKQSKISKLDSELESIKAKLASLG